MRIKKFRTIVTHDLGTALSSAKGILFLVFFGVFWSWILWKLSAGHASWLANPEANWFASWFLSPGMAKILFIERSPTLSSFFLIALFTAPFFSIIAASDQVAGDIGTKQLRFLVTRCQRSEIYFGRFVGTAIVVCSSYFVLAIIATFVALAVDGRSDTISYGIQISILLPLYVLPIIALMSIFSAAIGSMGLSLLTGLCVYLIFTIGIGILSIQFEETSNVIAYLLPNSLKDATLRADFASMLLPISGFISYSVIYLSLGWVIFKKRDI